MFQECSRVAFIRFYLCLFGPSPDATFVIVPQGAAPRSLVVHLRASLTRTRKPGDAVMVSGIFLPQPYTGFKAMRAGLLTTTFLEAMSVTQEKKSYAQTAEEATLRAQIDVSFLGSQKWITELYSDAHPTCPSSNAYTWEDFCDRRSSPCAHPDGRLPHRWHLTVLVWPVTWRQFYPSILLSRCSSGAIHQRLAICALTAPPVILACQVQNIDGTVSPLSVLKRLGVPSDRRGAPPSCGLPDGDLNTASVTCHACTFRRPGCAFNHRTAPLSCRSPTGDLRTASSTCHPLVAYSGDWEIYASIKQLILKLPVSSWRSAQGQRHVQSLRVNFSAFSLGEEYSVAISASATCNPCVSISGSNLIPPEAASLLLPHITTLRPLRATSSAYLPSSCIESQAVHERQRPLPLPHKSSACSIAANQQRHLVVSLHLQPGRMAAEGGSLRPSGPGQAKILLEKAALGLAAGEVITMAVKTAILKQLSGIMAYACAKGGFPTVNRHL
ncbi:probable DNA replication licensing factor MCM7 at N-terminal half [Coccomyxa sp. Obi]|nr:probable DNA replication licensing factor MCM7 at N-terminal half [Coccomyxa sp. Obi]